MYRVNIWDFDNFRTPKVLDTKQSEFSQLGCMCNRKVTGASPVVCERAHPETQGAGSSEPFLSQDVKEITVCL